MKTSHFESSFRILSNELPVCARTNLLYLPVDINHNITISRMTNMYIYVDTVSAGGNTAHEEFLVI